MGCTLSISLDFFIISTTSEINGYSRTDCAVLDNAMVNASDAVDPVCGPTEMVVY